MNIYESIYCVQMNDYYEMKRLIQYYRPMVTEIWADIFARKTSTILCEKEEFYRHADLLLYHCIFEFRLDRVMTFSSFYRRCLKNKAYDILRDCMRKQYQTSISLDQKIREDVSSYYGDIKLKDELEVHDLVMDQLMWEYTKNKILKVFGEEYVHVIDLRMEGYTLKYIANELDLTCSKVDFMFKKVKKWITTIDS